MTDGSHDGRRSSAFLIAAVALPLIVAGFFLMAVAIPRWTVASPNHDLLVRVQRFGGPSPTVTADIHVEGGAVVVTARPVAKEQYAPRWVLVRVDPLAETARDVPLGVPTDMAADATPTTMPVAALAGVMVSTDPVAPDGYRLQTPSQGGRGIVGGLFGMGRAAPRVVLAKQGRAVRIDLPQADTDPYGPVHVVGWVVAPKSR